jgi:hypothetical protein
MNTQHAPLLVQSSRVVPEKVASKNTQEKSGGIIK